MSRLIDADALKRKAQRVATESWKMRLTARIETTLNQFIDWIDNAPTVQPEPHWIPCSERLPKESGQYLITIKYKHVNDSYEDVYAEHGEWLDGKWDMFCFGHCGEVEDIIAWLPLPEPYKG